MLKIISVWGSPGSGKGTVSAAIAAKLAKHKKNVVIISSAVSPPALPIYIPTDHINDDGSLGNLLSGEMKSLDALKGFVHIHPKSDRIGFMGLVSGQTPLTYNAFSRQEVLKLINLLDQSPFDFVIFDCDQNPTRDAITLSAIQTSEKVLRLITPDTKGIEFEKSHLAWLEVMGDIKLQNQIRIYSPVYEFSPIDAVKGVIGGGEYELPFSSEVYGKFTAGQLVEDFRDKHGIRFEKAVSKLVERLMN
jgi:cellulose biosynthesis protein BcsQ